MQPQQIRREATGPVATEGKVAHAPGAFLGDEFPGADEAIAVAGAQRTDVQPCDMVVAVDGWA